jgi:hypothetical protein
MNIRVLKPVITVIMLALLCACGGGGGGGGGGVVPVVTSKAVATMKSANLTALGIYGLDITVGFPLGVTVATTADGSVAAGVISISGQQGPNTSVGAAKYTPATATARGSLRFLLVNPTGFTAQELVKVNLDITTGFSPTAAAFTIDSLVASDKDGNIISGLTADISTVIN